VFEVSVGVFGFCVVACVCFFVCDGVFVIVFDGLLGVIGLLMLFVDLCVYVMGIDVRVI